MSSSVVQLDMHCCEICMSMNRIMPTLCEHCLSGAGIYVDEARTISHAGRQAAQPNNTYIVVDTGPNEFSNFVRVRFHCCSNATSSNVGSITFPNGVTWTANYESFRITRYNAGTANAGCIVIYTTDKKYKTATTVLIGHINLDVTLATEILSSKTLGEVYILAIFLTSMETLKK